MASDLRIQKFKDLWIFCLSQNTCVSLQRKKMTVMKTLDKQTSDKISFVTYIVPAFADTYKMNVQDAFFYLKKYGGWDFLNEHWWALHTDSTFWAVRSIYNVCYQNGGQR